MFWKPWIFFSRGCHEIGPWSDERGPEVTTYEVEMGWLTFTIGFHIGWRK